MKTHPFILFVITLSLSLAACNLGAPAPQDGSAAATSAAQTIEAVLTTSAATPTAAQNTPAASPVPGVAIDGTTAEPADCQRSSKIVRWERNGITYDKAEVDKRLEPGTNFVMSWELQNTGTCEWDDTYKMIFDSGERLSQQDSFPVMPKGYRIKPGEVLTINLQLTAPAKAGAYETTFKLVDDKNNFALIVGVITNVGAATNSSLAAPGDLRYSYDCSGGITRISLAWKDKADNEEGYRIYRDGEKLTDLPAGSTVYDDIAPSPGSYQYTVAAYNAGGESPTKVQAETTNCQ